MLDKLRVTTRGVVIFESDPKFDGSRCPPFEPTYFQVFQQYEDRKKAVADPTTLTLIDEADRLGMNSLEQVRSIFDTSKIGIVLIGMPGIEKRMSRFPHFYSRIGFVHEFRPLAADEVHRPLRGGWLPPEVALPVAPFTPEFLAAIIRMTGGNFRLLNRLLTQIERVVRINQAQNVPLDIVDAAREKPRHWPGIKAPGPMMNSAQISTTNNSQDNTLR